MPLTHTLPFPRRRRRSAPQAARGLVAGLAAALLLGAAPAAAQSSAASDAPTLDLAATHAIVIDAQTGTVLLERDADAPIPPASMSKLMTAEMVFHALAENRLSLEDRFAVSENAFRKEGSTMFLNLTDEPTVAELLRGVIVQSGNDASVAVAEALAGSEQAFAQRMTERGRDIGLTASRFANATGLPDPAHRMSARDLATLALHIIASYPDYYLLYSEREFEWAGVNQRNRNPLLYLDIGGDGMKTGFTEEAGYGIVGSAVQNGRRVVAVIAGLPSQRARTLEIRRVLSWAFREFENRRLAEAGAVVGHADVWLGAAQTAPLALAEDLIVTVPVFGRGELEASFTYAGPARAPLAAGEPLGLLRVAYPGMPPAEARLVVAADVAEGGYATRVGAGFSLVVDAGLAELSRAFTFNPPAGAE